MGAESLQPRDFVRPEVQKIVERIQTTIAQLATQFPEERKTVAKALRYLADLSDAKPTNGKGT